MYGIGTSAPATAGGGSVEGVEALTLHDPGYHLGAPAGGLDVFFDDYQLACLLDRTCDRFVVHGGEGPQVDDLGLDPFVRQSVSRLERVAVDEPGSNECHVLALAAHRGLPERNPVRLLRHLALPVVEELVLEKMTGLGRRVAAQQSLGVVWGRRHDDLQAGDVQEPGLQALGVLGGGAACRCPPGLRTTSGTAALPPNM